MEVAEEELVDMAGIVVGGAEVEAEEVVTNNPINLMRSPRRKTSLT